MTFDPEINLACPYCNAAIYETLNWFKKPYATCPSCDKGLVAGQFAGVISSLEQAMDEKIEEMINGAPHTSCCGKESCCH